QLAFEPIDMGPMLGQPAGQSTIGGVVATNLSGSRRIQSGAVRDHVLGLKAVNGQGEIIKAGGRVMKNVTGYDLCRGLAGSWGTLGLFTEVTLRAQPAADESRTLLLFGQPDEIAVEVMCAAIGSQFEVSGAIHLQEALTRRLRSPAARSVGTDVTALRIESFGLAVARRAAALRDL
ncbi:MAG: FAD-binding protein, partial [Nitratireductor sp.]|nr:FAD-binding protein [Nitratireductor sp.]